MWIEPPCVQPIAPVWIAAGAVSVCMLVLSGLALIGVMDPLADALKRLVRGFRWYHAILVPGVMSLVVSGSTKPTPPPVVVEKGIKLTKCVQTSRMIDFGWIPEDDRIPAGVTYLVQEWLDGKWVTVAETKDLKYQLSGFTIDVTRRYRIVVDVTEAVDEE